MQSLTSSRRRWMRLAGTAATALLAATAVASAAGAATPSNTGATGSVAALGASSMEVQNPSSGQTTVNWTSSTTFSKTVSEAVSALANGDCLTVSGTPSKKSKTTIAARTITVRAASSSGTCTGVGTAAGAAPAVGGAPGGGGFGRFAGGGGFGAGAEGGTRPSFSGSGSSNFRKELASLAIASGKVTGVSGSTITVSGTAVSPGQFVSKSKSSKKSTPPKPKTEILKITTSGTTTVSATQTTASNALAVGDCVSAFGPPATNGSVTATTVRITATSGTCNGGFGGGFRGGFGGGGAGGAGA